MLWWTGMKIAMVATAMTIPVIRPDPASAQSALMTAQGPVTALGPVTAQGPVEAATAEKPRAQSNRPPEKNPFIEPMVITCVILLPDACIGPCPEWISPEDRIVAGQSAALLRRVIKSAGQAKPT